MERKITKQIMVGDVPVGGTSPITIQSMTNTITKDIDSTVNQILLLEKYGCDISRSAINDLDDAKAIKIIKEKTNIPFVADIQFDYRLAIAAVENGADCLRINPGNIGNKDRVREVTHCCEEYNVPIRVGVNSGSLHQKYLDKYGGVCVDSIVYSALDEVEFIESLGFYNMKLSLKSSDVNMSIGSYKKISEMTDYPLHLGITEAGPAYVGTIKSAVGIGSLLSQGIGDTIRVSLTAAPEEEIKVGKEILKSLGLRTEGVNIISCPTCARTKIDLISIVTEAEKVLENLNKNLNVAIMGCVVNGPGEAKEADIGIAGGNGQGLIFKKGEIVRKVKEEDLLKELIKEIENM
ncbi:flavodoxin-dependent (E)-4-hydroxy-3-methylbut-2-enyl-diphosphate synthase [Miniphocaeibacter massiliensis]|uniref:flavodoxin-dependent (E)-4-hydroxy-3-methylbut-2-enyl-diphosphate synthase n=1 Tax=Miniphocaeibacter massiliensis TaxID=2041841 RepID=UPI000C087C68|nr:flavodoxin-dependent (E)-4-hydroxy-3-methylbut-2-enyl-diphosphate synthase [Miniphocaeibacter massiliensis]